ncbi:MAG: cyclic nucleotide-binding domain-containing protein [Myxococcota bacterium]
MAPLGDVKGHAAGLFARGEPLAALRLYDAAVAAAPLDFEARLRVADCLAAIDEVPAAVEVYRAVAWYSLKSGHPLAALVAMRVLETVGAEFSDLLAALLIYYGRESEMTGTMAARINRPDPTTAVTVPDIAQPAPLQFIANAVARAARCTESFDAFPSSLHPIPLLSQLSEGAFRRVLSTLIVRRMAHGQLVVRQGQAGQSFFFVATGEVRVFTTDPTGTEHELARLHENAIFGEMALVSAQPRSASVQVVGEADLLEVTRESLAALADELDQLAVALHGFTRDRLLRNLMATHALFRPFNRAQQRDLLSRFTSHDVGPGTDIIGEGEPGRGLFVVLSGEVEVVNRTGDGQVAVLATLSTGDIFGEMSLVRGGVTTATVRATLPSTALFLDRQHVVRMIAGVPEIKQYLEALADDRQLDTRLTLDSLGSDGNTAQSDADDDSDAVIIFI